MVSTLFRGAARADTGQTSAETEDCQRRPPCQNEQGPAGRQGPLIKTLREAGATPARQTVPEERGPCGATHNLAPKHRFLGRFPKHMVAQSTHNVTPHLFNDETGFDQRRQKVSPKSQFRGRKTQKTPA